MFPTEMHISYVYETFSNFYIKTWGIVILNIYAFNSDKRAKEFKFIKTSRNFQFMKSYLSKFK